MASVNTQSVTLTPGAASRTAEAVRRVLGSSANRRMGVGPSVKTQRYLPLAIFKATSSEPDEDGLIDGVFLLFNPESLEFEDLEGPVKIYQAESV